MRRRGVVVRLHHRFDPRWVALLLMPVLVAAGAGAPEHVARGAIAAQRVAALPYVPPPATAAPPAVVQEVTAVLRPVEARRQVRAERTRLGRGGPLTAAQRGPAALDALPYDVAALGYRFRFLPYRGGGVLGTTNRRTRLITVYVTGSEVVLRATLAHEIGHALDFEHGTPQRRDAYRRIRSLPPGPWFPCNRCSDLSSPAGDFAEVFAVWLTGPGDFRGALQRPPEPAQLRLLDGLFRIPAAVRAAPGPAPARSAEPGPRPSARPDEDEGPLPALLRPKPSPTPGRL